MGSASPFTTWRPSDETFTRPSAQLPGVHGHENDARRGHLLHAPRQMGRLPDRGVVDAEIVGDGADHDLAGVESDPHRDAHADFPCTTAARCLIEACIRSAA